MDKVRYCVLVHSLYAYMVTFRRWGGGSQYTPQCIILLILRTPRKIPLGLGTPKMPWAHRLETERGMSGPCGCTSFLPPPQTKPAPPFETRCLRVVESVVHVDL